MVSLVPEVLDDNTLTYMPTHSQAILEGSHDAFRGCEGEGWDEGKGKLQWHDRIEQVIHPCDVIYVLEERGRRNCLVWLILAMINQINLIHDQDDDVNNENTYKSSQIIPYRKQ